MSFLSGLSGVLALMTRAPATQFSNFFGAPKPAFQNSLAAIGGSVLLMMVAARNIIHMQRHLAQDVSTNGGGTDDLVSFPALHIGITAFFYLLAFTPIAFMLSVIFDKRAAFLRWAVVRHWMVFYALALIALILVLARLGIFPLMLANAVLFTAFIGWLFADIRLAYKLGEMGLVSAVFAACMVHALGLSIVLTATVQMIA